MNTIEEQLWDYIDGNLDEPQMQKIRTQMVSDPAIRQLYAELMQLNQSFNAIEPEEPSLSFTRNVMESIRTEKAPVALKTKVDKRVIYAISGFFTLALFSLFAYVVFHAQIDMPVFKLKLKINVDQWLTPASLYIFLLIDLVIGLLFLDKFLTNRKNRIIH